MCEAATGVVDINSPMWRTFAVSSFDDSIGSQQQRRRDRQAERLCGLQIDDQLELRGLLDGKIARLRALQDSVDKDGSSIATDRNARAVSQERAGLSGHRL